MIHTGTKVPSGASMQPWSTSLPYSQLTPKAQCDQQHPPDTISEFLQAQGCLLHNLLEVEQEEQGSSKTATARTERNKV